MGHGLGAGHFFCPQTARVGQHWPTNCSLKTRQIYCSEPNTTQRRPQHMNYLFDSHVNITTNPEEDNASRQSIPSMEHTLLRWGGRGLFISKHTQSLLPPRCLSGHLRHDPTTSLVFKHHCKHRWLSDSAPHARKMRFRYVSKASTLLAHSSASRNS